MFDVSALDRWTDPRGNSIWAFLLLTSSRKEYLLRFKDLLKEHHIAQNLSDVIIDVIERVGSKKFVTIVSDNVSNVMAARWIVIQKYPNIININCIAHCINLISLDIVKIIQVKYLVKCCNILTKFFKNSNIAGLWLKEAIDLKEIEGGNLKTYVKTCWTTVYDCVASV